MNFSIDSDDKNTHYYYLVGFTSTSYTLQGNTSVGDKLLESGEIVANEIYFSPYISHPIW